MHQNVGRLLPGISSGDSKLTKRLKGDNHSKKKYETVQREASLWQEAFVLALTSVLPELTCVLAGSDISIFPQLTEKGQELWISQRRKTSRQFPPSCAVMGHLFI